MPLEVAEENNALTTTAIKARSFNWAVLLHVVTWQAAAHVVLRPTISPVFTYVAMETGMDSAPAAPGRPLEAAFLALLE